MVNLLTTIHNVDQEHFPASYEVQSDLFPRFRLVLLPVTFKAKNFRFSSAEKVLIFHPKTKKLEKLWLQISQQKNLSFQT